MAEERAFGVGEAVEDAASPTHAHNEIELDLAGGDGEPQANGSEAGDAGEAQAGEAGDGGEEASAAAQRDEYLALAQRTQADFENYRKRVAREAGLAESRGLTRLARELLPALDNLDRALAHAADADAAAALIVSAPSARSASGSTPRSTRRSRSSRSTASRPARSSRSTSPAIGSPAA